MPASWAAPAPPDGSFIQQSGIWNLESEIWNHMELGLDTFGDITRGADSKLKTHA